MKEHSRPAWLTDELLYRAKAIVAQHAHNGSPYGREALIKHLGLTDHKAKWLAGYLKTQISATGGPQAPQGQPLLSEKDLRDSLSVEGQPEGDSMTVEYRTTSPERVRDIESLLHQANVDLETWYVHEPRVKTWEGFAMPRAVGNTRAGWERQDGHPIVVTLYSVQVSLKRRVPFAAEQALKTLQQQTLEAMRAHAPAYSPRPRVLLKRPHLGVIGLFDLHLGSLVYKENSGYTWSLEEAQTEALAAIEAFLGEWMRKGLERICFPIGNDLIHINSRESKTFAGTPQEVSHHYWEIKHFARDLMRKAIERLLDVAPVYVPVVMGNHSPDAELEVGDWLAAWFRNAPEVVIDSSPNPRKYLEYGINLLGFTHGNAEKHRDLPLLMAQEAAEAWGRTYTREWLLGHYHTQRGTEFGQYREEGGVLVRQFSSLTPTNEWHHRKGYTKAPWMRRADGILYNPETGYAGHVPYKAR